MTREEAIERFFAHNPQCLKTLNKIMAWDETKSTKENGDVIFPNIISNINRSASAQMFGRRFGLKWVSRRKFIKMHEKPRDEIRYRIMKIARRYGLTHETIAKGFNITKQQVQQHLAAYQHLKTEEDKE